jgi:alkane 1-monooxygenase
VSSPAAPLPQATVGRMRAALPFWLSLGFLPLLALAAVHGLWALLLPVLYGWVLVTVLDALLGLNDENADTSASDADLFWHRAVTLVWFPLQAIAIFGSIWWVAHTSHLHWLEEIGLFLGVAVMTGPVGIVYSHELMHQKNRLERWLADLLLASVLYSHFRSEHLRVHHLYVGTPRDSVSARYDEGFHAYFRRVLRECPRSAWRAEVALLARAGRPWWHAANPFWRYAALQVAMLVLACVLGGMWGLALFVFQAFIAVWQLELTNYVEHYGLTREHLGDGRYEPVKPRHSWNAAQTASNWLMINLQRHSDHHFKPDRRYPLLQTYGEDEAPQLPLGYPMMTAIAMFPPVWRRVMNPRVRDWRKRFYPHIRDWVAYEQGLTPLPPAAP